MPVKRSNSMVRGSAHGFQGNRPQRGSFIKVRRYIVHPSCLQTKFALFLTTPTYFIKPILGQSRGSWSRQDGSVWPDLDGCADRRSGYLQPWDLVCKRHHLLLHCKHKTFIFFKKNTFSSLCLKMLYADCSLHFAPIPPKACAGMAYHHRYPSLFKLLPMRIHLTNTPRYRQTG